MSEYVIHCDELWMGTVESRMRRFTLTWSRTITDTEHDLSAVERGVRVGRVHRVMGDPADRRWSWSMFARLGNRQATAFGFAENREEALRLVENRYHAFRGRLPKKT